MEVSGAVPIEPPPININPPGRDNGNRDRTHRPGQSLAG